MSQSQTQSQNQSQSQSFYSIDSNLSIEDHIYQVVDLISMTTTSMPTMEVSSPDSHSVHSCDTWSMDEEPTERGMLDVRVVPALYHRTNSNQVHTKI